MATIISSNITSPLGLTTEENYRNVRNGRSGLSFYPSKKVEGGWKELPFDIEASLFSEKQWQEIGYESLSRFQRIAMHSVTKALAEVNIDKHDAIFILSSTKGDVDFLDDGKDVRPMGEIARNISQAIGLDNEPISICNACISGISALILGQRLVDSGCYHSAVICGADIQSRFIVSGFQSFKALSPEACRPFDIERLGLNLGEAAATVVLSRDDDEAATRNCHWQIKEGAVRNDAYHISAPHPKGEGAYRALACVTNTIDSTDLAVVGVHGTATMYNDQMESKAIERAGLLNNPVSALKGYYGHTMGAAGVLETILTARALDDGIILPSKGFAVRGVSGKVILSNEEIATDKKSFVKMLSGFGGCNGAIRLTKQESTDKVFDIKAIKTEVSHSIKISPTTIVLDGKEIATTQVGKNILTEVYKAHINDYPKFYKMDILSRLAFVASELLLKEESPDDAERDNMAIIMFNHSSSIVSDRNYEESISDRDAFYPSPATFVYTLPNIANGEIAIRHGIHGETSFFILPEKSPEMMDMVLRATFAADMPSAILTAWIDCPSEDNFECEMKIIK